MQNRICLITGASSGIGKVAAIQLARQGMEVILVGRNPQKGEAARREVLAASASGRVDLLLADLSDPEAVAQLAREVRSRYERLDVLINNAGLISDGYQTTREGIEYTFATNHLGPFLLTNLLLNPLRKGQNPRIVHVSSGAHRFARFDLDDLVKPRHYGNVKAYANSKLANILFSNELAARLKNEGITSNSLEPGAVKTDIWRRSDSLLMKMARFAQPFMRSAEEGAQTTIYLASSPEVQGVTGLYFADKKPKKPSGDARSTYYARALWEMSAKLTHLAERLTSFGEEPVGA